MQGTGHDRTYQYLLTLPRFADQGAAAYRPGLENMVALMEAMEHPHRQFPSVHVAGTNGKGSTASLIAAVATASGKRVGLHTSPHLYRVTERMRVDGEEAPASWLGQTVERFRPIFDRIQPSFFEATVALSFLYFAELKVDLAVIEVGMGGRLDATNVILPLLSVITSIGTDHAEFLGDTPRLISREKAGIIKTGIPVITSAIQPEAVEAIRSTADERGAPFHRMQDEVEVSGVKPQVEGTFFDVKTPLRQYESLFVGLPGRHQLENALLALRSSELVLGKKQGSTEAVYAGFKNVRRLSGLRGRLDVLEKEPLIVIDVSHNPEGLEVSLQFVRERITTRQGRLFVLFGAMRDKDVPRMAKMLTDAEASVFLVSIDSGRALRTKEMARLFAARGTQVAGQGKVMEGITWFRRLSKSADALLVTGSHQVVSQVPEDLLKA